MENNTVPDPFLYQLNSNNPNIREINYDGYPGYLDNNNILPINYNDFVLTYYDEFNNFNSDFWSKDYGSCIRMHGILKLIPYCLM